MDLASIGQLHKLQRYCRFTLALIAIVALAMLVVGMPAVRVQINKLRFTSATRKDTILYHHPLPG
jgi:hypothetical protein